MHLYSTVDVARLLKVEEHRLIYAFRAGRLAEPEHYVAGRRLFTGRDLQRVATYFGVSTPVVTTEGARDE